MFFYRSLIRYAVRAFGVLRRTTFPETSVGEGYNEDRAKARICGKLIIYLIGFLSFR